MPTDFDRSLARIEIADLLWLAADAGAELFRPNPQSSGRYAGRLLGRALCQGAALHHVNESDGVKDFDVRPSLMIQCRLSSWWITSNAYSHDPTGRTHLLRTGSSVLECGERRGTCARGIAGSGAQRSVSLG
jgi:hypothetical protein